jgi:hypothetical protein
MTKPETSKNLKNTALGISQAQLNLLERISTQQITISQQLAELLEVLTRQPETSLIEQLAELLQPISNRLTQIEAKLPPQPPQEKP